MFAVAVVSFAVGVAVGISIGRWMREQAAVKAQIVFQGFRNKRS